jgi:hypothetical protein
MRELIRNSWLVSAKGGTLEYVAEGGEVLFDVAVPPGKVSANEYLELCPDGVEVQVTEGLAVIWPKVAVAAQAFPDATESGANPDFVSTGIAAEQRRLAVTLGLMQSRVDQAIEARFSALSLVEPVATPGAEPVPPENEQP